ncbi:protein kinase [Corallococcus exercitus]|uniref:protein kinase domain-containing protein n=1 Tax=Corallococcus exercitus TaxID=2316736 RepID=UPI0035D426C4
MALRAGDVFGRYELVSWLGRGGMAETWRAQLVGDAGVTKPVLIKKVLPQYANNEAFTSMFISEARISATLSHGNVAQVFDFGRVDGEYFLAMEFVDGQPLHRILKRAVKTGMPALPIPVAVFIAREMCRGLHYAHTRTSNSGQPLDIVHRDISPDNVLVSYEGQVKIVDFGIAKARGIRGFDTAPGIVKGKYLFFSPEQARGEEVDARTDVWATGVVLYELLCGQLPVNGPPHVVMMRVGSERIPAPITVRPDLPKALNDIIVKALTLDREQRFESSHMFGNALASFLYSSFPRFSSMSVSHLLRMLFKEDLAQDGRELSVPNSFQEELEGWRESKEPAESTPTPLPSGRETRSLRAVTPPVQSETDESPTPPAPTVAGQRLLNGLLVVGLLNVVGACVWLMLKMEFLDYESPPDSGASQPLASAQPNPTAAASSPESEPVGQTPEQVSSLVESGKLSEALVLAERCLKNHPQAPECHLALGLVHARLSHFDDSDRHYETFVHLTPDGYPERDRVIQVLSAREAKLDHLRVPKKPSASAQAQIRGVSAADFDEATKLHEQAQLLDLNGRYPEAIIKARKCIALVPTFYDCALDLGFLYYEVGDLSRSKEYYKLFLKTAPDSHYYRSYIASLLNSGKLEDTRSRTKNRQ